MNRLTLQTRAIAPLLRTPFLGRLSCDLPGKSLVHLASTSTCVACSKSWSRRYKKSTRTVIIMKTPVSLCSTLGKSELDIPSFSKPSILENPGYRKDVVKLCSQLGINITDKKHLFAPFIHESFLLTHDVGKLGFYESNEKLAFLGAQVMRKCVTEHLYHSFPELTAREIWDVQTGLLEDHVLVKALEWKIKGLTVYSRQPQDLMLRQAVLALVGAVYTHESPERADEFVKSHLIPELTKSGIEELVKLQHPKFVLQAITDKLGHPSLQTRLDYSRRSKSNLHLDNPFIYSVSVLCGEDSKVLAQEISHSLTLAEKKACQKALINHYADEFHQFHLTIDDSEFSLEPYIDLGLIVSEQRVVELDKREGSFGFHIKGGEKRKKKTEQWLVFHYTTPIFVSHILPGGLADRHGGLSVGDRILAVNDRSMEGLDHERAVSLLKSVSGHVTLTVSHCKEALIMDKVEMKHKEMRRRKRVAELASDIWSDWHQAQANRHPSQYKDVLNYVDIDKESKKP